MSDARTSEHNRICWACHAAYTGPLGPSGKCPNCESGVPADPPLDVWSLNAAKREAASGDLECTVMPPLGGKTLLELAVEEHNRPSKNDLIAGQLPRAEREALIAAIALRVQQVGDMPDLPAEEALWLLREINEQRNEIEEFRKLVKPVETTVVLTDEEKTLVGQSQAELAVMKKDARTYHTRRVAGKALEAINLLTAKVRSSSVEPIRRHSRDCACTSCHYSKKFPQVKPHHATCGCFECAPEKASERHVDPVTQCLHTWQSFDDGQPVRCQRTIGHVGPHASSPDSPENGEAPR